MSKKKENESIIEKRRYPRLPIKIKFYQHDNELIKGDGLLHFFSKNLSCGGVYLKCDSSLSPGNILHMDFKLPENDQIITVSGVIIRKDPEGVGVRFLTLTIDEFETVESFVNSRL